MIGSNTKKEKNDSSELDFSVIELDTEESEEERSLKRRRRIKKGVMPMLPPITIDLTQANNSAIEIDSSEEEDPSPKSVKKRKQTKPISIEIPDSNQPELIDLAAIEQKNTMLFQYRQQLGIEDDEKSGIRMRQIKKNVYALQSKAYEKYRDDAEKQALKSLVSMVEHLDETQANDLLNDEWLNDEIVNKYLGILEKQNDPIAFVRSCYGQNHRDFFENLKNDKKRLKDTRNKLLNAQRILWPISDDSHWYLLIIDKLPNGKFNLFCLDSLNSEKSEYLEKAKLLLQNLYPEKSTDELVHHKDFIRVPKQNNGVDCGVALCYYAKLCTNKALPKNKAGTCNYSQFRFDIAEEFAKSMDVQKAPERSPVKKRHPKHH